MFDDTGENPFATHLELAKRWKQMPDDPDYVDQRLADASQFLREQCPGWRNISRATLERIACELAKDAISSDIQTEGAGFDTTGASNLSLTAGNFTQSMTFANPRGEFYLSKGQKKRSGSPANASTASTCQTGRRHEGRNRESGALHADRRDRPRRLASHEGRYRIGGQRARLTRRDEQRHRLDST